MEIKIVKDNEIFKATLNDLNKEYGDDIYNAERINKEYTALVENSYTMCGFYVDNALIGHIFCRKPDESGCASLASVFINENMRGKGYGKEMFKLFEEYAKSVGIKRIVLGARRYKEGFYYSCGLTGNGLLQANCNDMSKENLEKILTENNIPYKEYVFRNEKIHQFYFDANYILQNRSIYEVIDKFDDKVNILVAFSKNLD